MTYSLNPFARDSDIPYAAIGSVFTVTLGKMLDAGRVANPQASPLPYVRAANIQDTGLDLNDVNTMPFTAIEAAALDLRRNDVLVVEGGAVGTCVVLQEDLPGWSFQKTVNRLRPTSDWSSRFIAYVLRAYRDAGIIDIVCNKSTIPHLTAEKLRALRVPALPPRHQEAIANYLDRETARIDTLIEEQQRLIEMLRERRKALIEKAVFAGLWNADTNNSPESWLPSTPVHWRVVQLGFVCDTLAGYAFPSDGFSADDTHARLLRGVNVKPGRIDWVETVYWDTEASAVPSEYELEAGDLVFGMDRPFVGSGVRVAAISSGDLPALLLQRVMRIRPMTEGDRAYMRYVMSTDAFFDYLEPLFTGVSVPHVSEWQVRKFKMPFPPLDEQHSIAAHLDEVTAKIDQLIAETERFVDLAQERRTTLITAAVTGQIDVREAA